MFAFSLQKAVYARLISDAYLQALVGNPARVWNATPDNEVFPYITLRIADERDADAALHLMSEHSVEVHAWSRYQGAKEVFDILGAAKSALHEQTLMSSEAHIVNVRHQQTTVFLDADGRTWHGVSTYRAVTHNP